MGATATESTSPAANLDFHFFIGSTYTYLAVNRARALAAAAGVTLNWRPYSLRTILREQDNSPFLGKPDKLRYMWRDIERRAQRCGIPFAGPTLYPIDPESRASHVATLAQAEGWCEPFVREVYRTWFLDKLDPGSPQVLAGIVARVGQPADVLERAQAPEVQARYAANTVAARAEGVFGSPSFVTADGEVFWGDDRLEEALEWACSGRPRALAPAMREG